MHSGTARHVVCIEVADDRLTAQDAGRLDAAARMGDHVLAGTGVSDVAAEVVDRLVAATTSPLAASASCLPVPGAPAHPATVDPNPFLTDAPTLATPDGRATLLVGRALQLLAAPADPSWNAALARWSRAANDVGLRHVAAPGTAMRAVTPPARDNTLLDAHVLWAETRFGPLRLLIDGTCLPPEPATGTHRVILELATWMQRLRADAVVRLFVRPDAQAAVQRLMEPAGIEVIDRPPPAGEHHVVYRPFQMLDPAELPWLRGVAQRWVFSQLDMIAFSNSSYHPDPTMSATVSNLQRAMLRHADGVTFISEFGRATAASECPELDDARCIVVPIGVDVVPLATDPSPPPVAGSFMLCLAADFLHKNRLHALAVFAEARRRGYGGGLVLAGHELHYGSSAPAETELVASFPDDLRVAVHRLGPVDERTKWWLLANADAVIYPSVVEGFGLVPFEAASVGTPTLAAAGSAFEELTAGSDVELASSWSVAEWADTLLRWIDDDAAADRQVDAIRAAGATFTWERTARVTWDLIDAVVALPPRSAPASGRDGGGSASRVEHLDLGLRPTARAERFARRAWRGLARRIRARVLGRIRR